MPLVLPRLLLAALFLTGGCARTPPRQRIIEADTPVNYTHWQGQTLRDLAPGEERLFLQAVAEIKYQIMLEGRASGAEQLDTALRADLHGRKLGDVLLWGLSRRADRLAKEKAEAEQAYATNAPKEHRIRDVEKAAEFAALQQRLREKITRLTSEAATAAADLRQAEAR